MRFSQSFLPTMKETPAGAEVPSHQLMLRAGLVRQLMAGAYSFLPLGVRVLRKAEAIIREEMVRAGAAELLLPALHPIELYEQTGRREAFGNVLMQFKVRRGNTESEFALGPTHEEVITDLVGRHVSSYRSLPMTLFQVQTKFRNEERPRFGVLRTSEFLMKDAYSFGTNLEQLDDSYQAMYDAYCRIFARCGLEYLPVEAESGPIGGDASHEFMIPAENGEDEVVHCPGSGYAANTERAEIGERPLPEPADVPPHEEVATPEAGSIEQVSQMLGLPPERFVKTLVYVATTGSGDEAKTEPVLVLLRGDGEANDGKLRRATGADTIELADEKTVERVTGAPRGFAGPVGLAEADTKIVADVDAVAALRTGAVVGANKKDAHFKNVQSGRDFPEPEPQDLRNAVAGDPSPDGGGALEVVRGIEVGHVFKLGTKYSEALDATYLDETEKRHPIVMGCYGIGVSRVVAGLAETRHDENGLLWPLSVCPAEVVVVPLNMKADDVRETAEGIYQGLLSAGVDAVIDDRPKLRPGVKFADADLIGSPCRVVIGGRGLTDGVAEIKWRTEADAGTVPLEGAADAIAAEIGKRKAAEQDTSLASADKVIAAK